MRRRDFLAASGAGLWTFRASGVAAQNALGAEAFRAVGSKFRVTGLKIFGVSLTPDSDRPYVFVKLETNQGVIGWGEATLEGKAGAVMACIEDFSSCPWCGPFFIFRPISAIVPAMVQSS